MQDYLPDWAGQKLLSLVEAVPHDDHMLHGDYHTKNLELQNDEVLLIDMDTLAVGHPIFELASMFNAFVGFSEQNHEVIKKFQGFDFETAGIFWRKSMAAYLGTDSEAKFREVEDKARIIGYTRLIRRSIRRGGLGTESGRAEISFWKERLLALLEKTDSLVFSANELELEASAENLGAVQTFVDERLQAADCPPNIRLQVSVAVEEIFVNIANYAYKPGAGSAVVRVEVAEDPVSVSITFLDHGVPYDPLTGKDPDLKRAGEGGDMHGLGVFMTKKLMDGIAYEYKNGQNKLTLKKNL
jgi:anti-sigma regulatory factor (Ser/Thr protein kinase)